MFNMLDIYERAVKGPIMSEKDFDMKIFLPNMKDVVKKYGIRYDKENPVPSDDAAADNLFEAGVEFLTRVGVYCQGTNRVMQFTEQEIRQVLKEAPGQCFPGKGNDAGILGMRKPDESKYPWFHNGTGIAFSSEELMTHMIEGCATIAEINSISFPALEYIPGCLPWEEHRPNSWRPSGVSTSAFRQSKEPGGRVCRF